MTDKESNEDNSTDFPIREQLVNTAIGFLLNPDVQKRNDVSKIKFLKNKGLTDAEIQDALDRAKIHFQQSGASALERRNQSVPPPLPYHYQPYSFWSRLSGISSSLIVFGVAIYGLHHFYIKYIRPWLFEEESENDALVKNLVQLNSNLTTLTESVEKLQSITMKQNEEVNKLLQLEGFMSTSMALEEIQRDVNSLKSILISRHQFPAAPQLQKATIPTWQLSASQSQSTDSHSDNRPTDPFESESIQCKADQQMPLGQTTTTDVHADQKNNNTSEINDSILCSTAKEVNITELNSSSVKSEQFVTSEEDGSKKVASGDDKSPTVNGVDKV